MQEFLSDSICLMKKHRIPFAQTIEFKKEKELEIGIKKIGFPCVLKANCLSSFHKTEKGFVKIAENRQELEKALEQMKKSIKKNKAKTNGFLLQRKAEGMELIIGAKKDKQFGNILLFGLGGIFAEIMKDVSIRICPINEKTAFEMMQEIKGKELLNGYRNTKAINKKSLARIMISLSKLMEKNNRIKEIDLNPIIASEKKCIAIDTRIINF